jgi:putative membrane protein insertion efficiency factor
MISRLLVGLLVALLRVYQIILSPMFTFLGARCRFHPTCSAYAIEAIRVHGPIGGVWRAARRLSKCHPFHPGGVDLVEPRRTPQQTTQPEAQQSGALTDG